ncbi:MAG: Smr/MutS family protein [Bacteroidaceae bacterium]|nr:Smr/MutS family protein [Bacteroidaceae bacterium]
MIYPSSFEEKIEMTEIRAMLLHHCLSPLGEERVTQISFMTDAKAIREQHARTGEFARIMAETDSFPDHGFYDLRPALRRIRVEGTYLEVEDLWDLKRSLEAIAEIRTFLRHDEGESPYPALSLMADGVMTFPLVTRRIDSILDKFGRVKDTASGELQRIRRELSSTEGSITRLLNNILRSAQQEGLVAADVSPTMRDGRLVIPVAPALKRRIKGIIHDESATGKTVFIEPQEAVEVNNRIRELEGEERREIIRILHELTDQIRPLAPQMLDGYEFLADIEFVRAKAHFAKEIGALTTTEPNIAPHPLIDWTLAIHPLLQRTLQRHGKRIVPLDIELNRRQRILIISGPNAGGKSVCLKTVGLLQYMMQCGLPVTLGENSRLGIFNNIMLDIGDEQSIEDELSTYSSHLLNMKNMMRQANPSTLLLIDELGGGTEPQIGGAMAEAVLSRFVRQGAFGIITTHYQNLKLFADHTPGVANGAMLYDRHLMQALFQLEIGNPGSSFAVEIARKIGIPEDVISDASDIVGRDYINADKWLQDIVRDKRYWESKRQAIHSQEKQMAHTMEEYESEMTELQKRRKDILREAREQAAELLKKANAQIENTIREIREAQAERERTRTARSAISTMIDELNGEATDSVADSEMIDRKIEQLKARKQRQAEKRARKDKTEAQPATETVQTQKPLSLGDTVRIKGQTSVGVIERIDGHNATVVFGQMRTSVKANRLERAIPPKTTSSMPLAATFVSRQTRDQMRETSLHFNPEIDVRGMRGEEALNAVMHYIDDAVLVGASRVRILHGTGNGILRTLIRQYLNTVSSVADAHDEHVQFGGAGITIVELK